MDRSDVRFSIGGGEIELGCVYGNEMLGFLRFCFRILGWENLEIGWGVFYFVWRGKGMERGVNDWVWSRMRVLDDLWVEVLCGWRIYLVWDLYVGFFIVVVIFGCGNMWGDERMEEWKSVCYNLMMVYFWYGECFIVLVFLSGLLCSSGGLFL